MSEIPARLLTPWRLKWYPRVAVLGLLLALLVVMVSASGSQVRLSCRAPEFGRLGGDYTEFYGAGRIVVAGHLDKLYDSNEQCAMQKEIVLKQGTYVPFAYPPQMALLYSSFSLLPFRVSFYLHTLLMLAALAWSLHLIQPQLRRSGYYDLAFSLLLFYYPVLKAALGGQNTPLTVLLLCASYAALRGGRELTAGACLGLLLYKPQLAIVMLCLLLLIRKWRAFLAGAGVGIVTCSIDCFLFGTGWVSQWYSYARWVVATSMSMEGEKAISLLQFLANALGTGAFAAQAAGYLLAGSVSCILAFVWWSKSRQLSLLSLYGLAASGVILISPHTYYYDSGILLLSCCAIYHHYPRARIATLSLVWFLGMLQLFAADLHFSPVFFSVVICFVLLVRAALASGSKLADAALSCTPPPTGERDAV